MQLGGLVMITNVTDVWTSCLVAVHLPANRDYMLYTSIPGYFLF